MKMKFKTDIISSQSIILRPFKIDDAYNMFNNWASDQEITKYISWNPHLDLNVTKQVINNWLIEYENNQTLNWAIDLCNENNNPYGSIGISKIIDHDTVEIGYVLAKKWWNKGIISKSLKMVINYIFQNTSINKIQAVCNVNNIGSQKVLEKNNMKLLYEFNMFIEEKQELWKCFRYEIKK